MPLPFTPVIKKQLYLKTNVKQNVFQWVLDAGVERFARHFVLRVDADGPQPGPRAGPRESQALQVGPGRLLRHRQRVDPEICDVKILKCRRIVKIYLNHYFNSN